MVTANETAEKEVKLLKGVYLMTDIFGNQRKVKITPAEKSIKIEMLEPAPKLRTNDDYDEFLYKKGVIRLLKASTSHLYCWDDSGFKLYPKEGSEPLYFEKI